MIPNDVLRRLRYALNLNDAAMIDVFAQSSARLTADHDHVLQPGVHEPHGSGAGSKVLQCLLDQLGHRLCISQDLHGDIRGTFQPSLSARATGLPFHTDDPDVRPAQHHRGSSWMMRRRQLWTSWKNARTRDGQRATTAGL